MFCCCSILSLSATEHQSHLALSAEERFGTALAFMSLAHQTEVHSHPMQGKKTFHASKLTVFGRNSKKVIKLAILEGLSLGCSRKDVILMPSQLICNSPDSHSSTMVGGIFIITCKGVKFLSHYKSIGYKIP
jgi:hypothetical protein